MAPVPALGIEALSLRFGQTAALRDLHLAVDKGEVVSLVGHSGCGKSSLLRLIAGVETPDHGRISFDGHEVVGPSCFIEPEKRHVGFVFQDYALFPHLSVEANVRFGLRTLAKAEARERAIEMLKRVDLSGHAKRYPHELSGGEQQRVALARALAPAPRLLLLDEPFSNLDPTLRQDVRQKTLSLIRSLGMTAIIVSHDPEEALSSGDRVVLMRAGEIVQVGSAYDLYDRPNSCYAAEFFSPCNRIPGRVNAGIVATALGEFPAPRGLEEGDHVVTLVRPTDIDVLPNGGNGEVLARELMGEIESLRIRLPDLEEPVQARSTRRLPTDTLRVGVRASAGAGFVFPAEPSRDYPHDHPTLS